MRRPGVGDPAPDFDLVGTGGRRYSLSKLRGTPVVLIFYPGDDSAVCTIQLRSYSADFSEFTKLGAQVLALSPQDIESHEAFASRHDLAMPLLVDECKRVAEAYNILGPIGFYRRSVFVVDGEGIIVYAHRSNAGMTYRKTPELIAAIQLAVTG